MELRWPSRTARRVGLIVLLASLHSAAVGAQTSRPKSDPEQRERELEERLKRLEDRYEAMERRHAEAYTDLKKRYDQLSKQVEAPVTPRSKDDQVETNAATQRVEGPASPDSPGVPRLPSASNPGTIAPDSFGEGAEDVPTPARSGAPVTAGSKGVLEGNFSRGFIFETPDDEFQLQFHYLGQVDYRQYTRPNQDPVHSGFSFPRQRLYFTGRLTKAVEYYVTLNRSYGQIDIFDAYVNFHYDDRLQFKLGRYKTPYSYEFYALSAQDFIVPERSLFGSNFSPNRQIGLMAWGQFLGKRVDYAAGVFNGNRFSFQDTNDPKDVLSYVNARPFQEAEGDWVFLKNLNVGGSVGFGNEYSFPPQPSVLRTSIAASNAADATNIAPPFLAFERNVIESGIRSLWSAHFAYFYKSLSVIGEWNSGYYSLRANEKAARTQVPLDGYYVSMGYFLTGETLERRGPIKPLRPFKLGKEGTGPGAVELMSRYSALTMGEQVFTGKLADPSKWTNRLSTIDLGVNWYPNEYIKFVFAWEHAIFATPVLYRPDATQSTSDLFWMRMQVYF